MPFIDLPTFNPGLDDLATDASRAVLTVWFGQVAPGTVPHPRAVGPTALPARWLPHTAIASLKPGGVFHWRLLGTAITAAADRDLTGRDIAPPHYTADAARRITEPMRLAVRCRTPVRYTATTCWPDSEWLTVEGLLLPLSCDGVTVQRLLCVYSPIKRATRRKSFSASHSVLSAPTILRRERVPEQPGKQNRSPF